MSSIHDTPEFVHPFAAPGFQVTNWPIRDNPLRAGAMLAALIAVGIGAMAWSGSVPMGLVCLLALLATTWKLWLPVTCHFGAEGVTIRVFRWRRRLPWHQIDRVEIQERGVLLVLDADQSALCCLRSVYLPWCGRPHGVRDVCEHFHPQFTVQVDVTDHPVSESSAAESQPEAAEAEAP